MQKSNLGIFQQYSEEIEMPNDCSASYISYPNFLKAVEEILQREKANPVDGQVTKSCSSNGAVAGKLKTKYKYIHFVEGLKDEWTVWTNKKDEYLGVITYHKKWKEWEFAPEEHTGYTIECLNDLVDFIKHLPATASW